MNRSLRTQAVSFGLAALITLVTLMGLDNLAQGGNPAATWAKAAATQRA